jgi:RNA polymerase sigma factor (sigma-70 family)
MDGDFEAELVDKARRGDPSAAPFLVSCFGERLLGFGRAHAPDLSDADREQIVELAIEAGVRAIDRFDPIKGSLEAWFRGQIRFQTLGWRRRVPPTTKANDHLVDTPELPPTQPCDTDAGVIEALQRAISRLSRDDQLILALRSSEQVAFGEIAHRLGISEDAARQRHHRALRRLRTEAGAETGLGHLIKEAGK